MAALVRLQLTPQGVVPLISSRCWKVCPTVCLRPRASHRSVVAAASLSNNAAVVSRNNIVRQSSEKEGTLSIIVLGASGDLAKKKIYPALFALFYEGRLPKNFRVIGYARSKITDESLRTMVSSNLTCRIDKMDSCKEKMEQFLGRCFYHCGQYNSEEHFLDLDKKLKEHERGKVANRLFYMSLPPDVFVDAARCASRSSTPMGGWTRFIVEKPFGRDSESSARLTEGLSKYLKEEQIFRIDHYLGKEMVKRLATLRKPVLGPLSKERISSVQLIVSEDFGTEGRGGYFDNYGIIRDMMQNHLLQMLALVAMEPPLTEGAEDIRNEKVKVLRCVRNPSLEDVVIGQYTRSFRAGVQYPGYTDDITVPADSITPTFAAIALFIDNARWQGVPFIMKAGKALNERKVEIRVRFRKQVGMLEEGSDRLVIRVQPDGAMYLEVNEHPINVFFDANLNSTRSDLRCPPDAYESLIHDALMGDSKDFIRSDELEAAWDIFTPLVKELENKKVKPEPYLYGSRGPSSANDLAAKYKTMWDDSIPQSTRLGGSNKNFPMY